MKLFQTNSPGIRLIDNIGSLVLLNLLYLLCCLPVVTAPAATTALYSCTLCMARREPLELSRFFRVFKQEFLPSLKAGALLLLVGGALAADAVLLRRMAFPAVLRWGAYALLFLVGGMAMYLFPLIARFENTLKQYLKLSLAMAIRHLPQTVFMLALAALPVILFLVNADLALRLMIFWVLFGAALCAWIDAKLLCRIFARYEPEHVPSDGEEH